jgi:hypothetical protein
MEPPHVALHSFAFLQVYPEQVPAALVTQVPKLLQLPDGVNEPPLFAHKGGPPQLTLPVIG